MSEVEYSVEKVMDCYRNLSCEDPQERHSANMYLLGLIDREEAWAIANRMIVESVDPNFQFLGAHILYQKIQNDISSLSSELKRNLKEFISNQLNSGPQGQQRTPSLLNATIDKLSSSFALISMTMLHENPNLISNVIDFMKTSKSNLKTGLIILQRIPQEMKLTNRISHGMKIKIQEELLKSSDLLALVFISALQLNEEKSILSCLSTLQSWVKFNFSLMRYNSLVAAILSTSTHTMQRLELSAKVICQVLKTTAQGKFQTLTEVDPSKEMAVYSAEQLVSFKAIVQFLLVNKAQLMQSAEISEIYTSMLSNLLLNYGFLLLEDIGSHLLAVMEQALSSADLKLSFSTFEFWNDFSEKVCRMKLPAQIQQQMWTLFQRVLSIVLQKAMITKQQMLEQAQMKLDDTVDDSTTISFNQYRKQAQTVLKFLYDYFHTKKGEWGISVFFANLHQLLKQDFNIVSNGHLYGRYTELALYALKASIQSMVHPYESKKIGEFIEAVLKQDEAVKNKCGRIPVRVAAQTMNLIKDCTKEIKDMPELILACLRFSLQYISDESLCYYSAYCFSAITESIKATSSNTGGENATATNFLPSLLQFYNVNYNSFTKQSILQRMLQGVFAAVNRSPLISALVEGVLNRALNALESLKMQTPSEHVIKITLIELKTMLDSFDSSDKKFKYLHGALFSSISSISLKISTSIIVLSLNMGSLELDTHSNQSKMSVHLSPSSLAGLSLKLIKQSLKFYDSLSEEELQHMDISQIMNVLQLSCSDYVLSHLKQCWEYSGLCSEILDLFTAKNSNQIISSSSGYSTDSSNSSTNSPNTTNLHLQGQTSSNNSTITAFISFNLNPISRAYLKMFSQGSSKIDPDILKTYLSMQASLIMYNPELYLHGEHHLDTFRLAIMSLKEVNQRISQKKACNYLLLCVGLNKYNQHYMELLQGIINCISVINSGCYINLSRILILITGGKSTQQRSELFSLLLNNILTSTAANLVKIIVAQFVFGTQSGVIRYLKMGISTLAQAINEKVSSDSALQAEIQLVSWKKEFSKAIKSGSKVINGELSFADMM